MQQLEAPPRPAGALRSLPDEIHRYAGIVRRGWKLITVGLIVGLVLAAGYLARSATVYRASARILLIQQPGRLLPGPNSIRDAQDAEVSTATHLMLIRSPVVVEQAIRLSGLGSIAPSVVINGLTAKQPSDLAKIVEISYKSSSHDEAAKIVEGVMQSYNIFLREKFQKNTNDVISLILKARDDLSTELAALERQYLEYRQKNPAYCADERGRAFVVRRLDQWDQSMNRVLARSLQLKSQLELGRKMAGEGLDQGAIAGAINHLNGLGETMPSPPPATDRDKARVTTSQSVQGLREEIADVRSRRNAADLLLKHLRRELAALTSNTAGVTDRAIAEIFNENPEVAKLQTERQQKEAKVRDAFRLSGSYGDPAIVNLRRRTHEIDEQIKQIWQRRRPAISAQLAGLSNEEIQSSIRRAEADLVDLKAREAALEEQLASVAAEQLGRLRQNRERLAQTCKDDHPEIRQIDQQIAQIERGKDAPPGPYQGSETLLGSLARSLEANEAMRAGLQAKFDEDLDASKKAEINQQVETTMRDNLDRHRLLFNSVVDQLKQAQLVSDYGSVSAQVINPTEVLPEKPRSLSILALAVIAGCGLGGLGAYLVDHLDARVQSVSEVRELLHLPVVGMIPQLSPEQIGSTGKLGLLSHEIPRSALAESYKSTRTNLEYLRRNRTAQVILVCSPQAGDGKSTSASNLAITLSHAGRKVLLIDGDLRKPSQHVFYDILGGRGLTDALKESGPVKDYPRSTCVENLDLLASGSVVSNPAELLASPRLGEILDQFRELYDIIIIDSSPMLVVTDPSIIAAVADATLLVVRVACTRRHEVERVRELVDTIGLPVLGVVINGARGHRRKYLDDYGSDQSASIEERDPIIGPLGSLEPADAATWRSGTSRPTT